LNFGVKEPLEEDLLNQIYRYEKRMDLIINFLIWKIIKLLQSIQNLQIRGIKSLRIYRGIEAKGSSFYLLFQADVGSSIIKEKIRKLLEFQIIPLPYRTPFKSKSSSPR